MKSSGWRLETAGLSRREFLAWASMSALALVTGCATNPVTGRRELMLVSEEEEMRMDRSAAPHQFSADYGPVADAALNAYVGEVGARLVACSHRPQAPFSFRVVNAVYANAYTFPAGSVAVTRGLLLELRDEAELAALLGHEIGHVCARHTARAMSWGTLGALVVSGASLYLGREDERRGELVAGLGQLAGGALLARYSRANEREADALAMDYMVRAGYSPDGMVGLMDVLRSLSHSRPGLVELLFATHPMSEERYHTARERVQSRYAAQRGQLTNRERFLERTAELRGHGVAIRAWQAGEEALARGNWNTARQQISAGLREVPDDYTGRLLLAKCCLAEKQFAEARQQAEAAHRTYPAEAQALLVMGVAALGQKEFVAAREAFERYGELLPGNPNVVFLEGYSLEGMNRRDEAARCYVQYLRAGGEGEFAVHARKRLAEWGYLK